MVPADITTMRVFAPVVDIMMCNTEFCGDDGDQLPVLAAASCASSVAVGRELMAPPVNPAEADM